MPVASGSEAPSRMQDQSTAPQPPSAAPVAVRSQAGPDLDVVRRMWPDILDVVKTRRRFTWMLLVDGVGVIALHDNTLVLAFADEGKRKNFLTSGSDELLSSVIHEVLRTSWRLDAVLDPARAIASAGPAHSVGGTAAPAPGPAGRAMRPSGPPAPSGAPPSTAGAVVDPAEDDSADINDETLATSGLSGPELLIRELGATVIEEIEHS
jgi:DNA polymerase-3 subunit gamma/tau